LHLVWVLSLALHACITGGFMKRAVFLRYIPIACRVYKNGNDSTTNEYDQYTTIFPSLYELILATLS
jgi:hypothetical protein